jgi:hypothetical protein
MKEKEQDLHLAKLTEISEKLDTLIRLSAISVVKGLRLKQQIEILSDAGFGAAQIADIVGEKANTVKVALYRLRKERAAAEAEERNEDEEPAGGSPVAGPNQQT